MKARFVFAVIATLILAVPSFAEDRTGPVGKMTVTAAGVEFVATGNYERVDLVIGTPDGDTITRQFTGNHGSLRVADLGSNGDGTYTFELRGIPRISAAVKGRLAAARAQNDEAAIAQIKTEAGIAEPAIQGGAFVVRNGTFIDGVEAPYAGAKTPGKVSTSAVTVPGKLNPAPNDVVTADDEIIQGSLCVGLDCVVNESFGFDTIRLKENNTRIHFQDTSTTSGCPNNQWQLTANDTCGGANKFSIDDITGSKTPFTITAAAPTNSIFVASSGKVGFGNNNPGLNLHITATDTPAIRQEQTNGGGFTAQTWDIGANEANWFVRDLTGGSRLPLRIRPGAPTSSIDIAASGQVGVGTASPSEMLHVFGSGATRVFVVSSNNTTSGVNMQVQNAGTSVGFGIVRTENNGDLTQWSGTSSSIVAEHLRITNGGNVGINCSSPSFAFMIGSSASGCTAPTSGINPGSTTFTTSSSRTFKENIAPVSAPNILDKIESVPVVTYDFKNGGPKDRMGLIAEDFYQVFNRGDDKHIDGQDVEMALWLAVQKLTAQNKELTDRLASLEKELQKKQ